MALSSSSFFPLLYHHRSLKRAKLEVTSAKAAPPQQQQPVNRWPISSAGFASAASSGGGAVGANKKPKAINRKKYFEKWAKSLEKLVPKEKFDSCMGERKVVLKEGAAMMKVRYLYKWGLVDVDVSFFASLFLLTQLLFVIFPLPFYLSS